jgi:chemotaxis methyl-accepting protein methylase
MMVELGNEGSNGDPAASDSAFAAVLAHVRKHRAVDFSVYRLNTIRRRLDLRRAATQSRDLGAYLHHLENSPSELDALIDALTIKVSHFFRNPLVFEVLRERVLPELLEALGGKTLRVWCAGCARGEEPYSLVILLREILRKERFRNSLFVLATDIDTEALDCARTARYPAEALPEVKKGYLERYFQPLPGGEYRLNEEIRSMVTFATHDLASGRPPREGLFTDYHLILCRNVLIYFAPPRQATILRELASTLAEGGVLVLGEAESMLPEMAKAFPERYSGTKVFRKDRG